MNYANPYTYTDTSGYVHVIETETGSGDPQYTQRAHNEACEAMLAAFPEA